MAMENGLAVGLPHPSARAAGFGGHEAASRFDSDTWVNELLSRNDELIEAIAQNQGLGRTADALTYQQLLQNREGTFTPTGRFGGLHHLTAGIIRPGVGDVR